MNRDPNAVDSRRRGEKHVETRLLRAPGIIYVDYDVASIADELHQIAGTWPKTVDVDDDAFWPIVERHALPPLDEKDVQDKIDKFFAMPGGYEQKLRILEHKYSKRVRYRVMQAFSDHVADIAQARMKEVRERELRHAAKRSAAKSAKDALARSLGIIERR